MITPIYGHTSPETAYLVTDYPYGNKRCRIRYWLETDATRGYRFVSQTEHPTRLVWNAPKKTTYRRLAACMFLDEKGHVTWSCLTEYSDHAATLEFIEAFPGAKIGYLAAFIEAKRTYLQRLISGEIRWAVNGVEKPESEADQARNRADLEGWARCAAILAERLAAKK